jgi:hypothetical protein
LRIRKVIKQDNEQGGTREHFFYPVQVFCKTEKRMKIIYSGFLPLKGFRAINLFGIVFAKKGTAPLNERILNHETIHTRQMLELFIFGFYIWYIVEWFIKWIHYKDRHKAYLNIGFEREAYDNDTDLQYLKQRKKYAFKKYL